MLLKKYGFPEESELVICTVTKIQFNSVFARLDEYGKSGMIHISEISPGRIRNIRDYVKEGKVIVCVVLRVNKERGHIDLSLRRVNEGQRRKKISQMKQEQRAEKIVELVAKKNNIDVRELFEGIWQKISEDYSNLYDFFEDYIAGNADFSRLKLKKEIEDELKELVKQRIKLPEVEIAAELKLTSYESNGIDVIKEGLESIKKDNVKLSYLGAGRYSLIIKADDYKQAEKQLSELKKKITEHMKKHNSFAELERISS